MTRTQTTIDEPNGGIQNRARRENTPNHAAARHRLKGLTRPSAANALRLDAYTRSTAFAKPSFLWSRRLADACETGSAPPPQTLSQCQASSAHLPRVVRPPLKRFTPAHPCSKNRQSVASCRNWDIVSRTHVERDALCAGVCVMSRRKRGSPRGGFDGSALRLAVRAWAIIRRVVSRARARAVFTRVASLVVLRRVVVGVSREPERRRCIFDSGLVRCERSTSQRIGIHCLRAPPPTSHLNSYRHTNHRLGIVHTYVLHSTPAILQPPPISISPSAPPPPPPPNLRPTPRP